MILLLVFGFISCILGYLWSLDFPVNKNLWTSSYVILTGGLAMLILAVLMFLIDDLEYLSPSRFGIVFGSNAITIYVLAYLLSFIFFSLPFAGTSLNEHFIRLSGHSLFSPKFLSLCYALMFVAVNYIPAYWLYKKKIFIKL